MSDTILEYLEKFGDKTFDRLPFGEVDALILAQFAYLKFDGLIPGPDESDSFIPIKSLKKNKDFAKLFSDTRYEKVNRELFTRMTSGKRFGTLSMTHYVNIVDKARDIQFSAITFKLSGGTGFVAFRGTDENMVGWKEDFNLSIMDRIPGEKEAVGYLKKASGLLSGTFYVGGHSKGGLLSVYASSLVPESIKKRIINVYSFDGPAVREAARTPAPAAAVSCLICFFSQAFRVMTFFTRENRLLSVQYIVSPAGELYSSTRKSAAMP